MHSTLNSRQDWVTSMIRIATKESLEKAFKSITDFNVEPFATKEAIQSGGIYMKPEDVASISKSMDAEQEDPRVWQSASLGITCRVCRNC